MARQTGSGGKRQRKLSGKGPTPRAEDRHWYAHHTKNRRPKSASRPTSHGKGAGPDWVVGRNPVLEALRADLPIKAAYVAEGSEHDDRLREIFFYAAEHSISLLQTTRAELDRLTGGAVHQGIALHMPSYSYADPVDLLEANPAGLIVALDSITDPHNLGAVARSAAAFGAHGIVIPERRSASVTAVAWKASAGALARIPVAKATNLNRFLLDAHKAGYMTVGLAGEADVDIREAPLDSPLVLVVGSEGDGLGRLTRERCDVLASIPISGVESLNASVAAGIACYEVARASTSSRI